MEVERATFERVKNSQLELEFEHIDKLIEGKETISKVTRRNYFELLAISLLGQDVDHRFTLEYEDNVYDLGPLPIFIRKMAYFEDTEDRKQEIMLKGKKTRVPIEKLWEGLRVNLYIPFSKAQTLAMKYSAEIRKTDSSGFKFKPGGE
jgi:hypothetical protein